MVRYHVYPIFSLLILPKIWCFNSSAVSIIIGFLTGLVINALTAEELTKSNYFEFREEEFAYIFLPLILFHDGYNVELRKISKNFWQIMFYGIFGTVASFFILYNLNEWYWQFNGTNDTSHLTYNQLILVICCMSIKCVTSIELIKEYVQDTDLFGFMLGECTLFSQISPF